MYEGTQEEAAEAYDIAAIKFRGLNAVTNFDMSRYDVKTIANSNLPVGGGATGAGKAKASPSDSTSDNRTRRPEDQSNTLIFSKPDDHQLFDQLSVWGYQKNNNNNPILESSFPFQSCSNNMYISTAPTGLLSNGNGGYIQQQQQESNITTSTTNSNSSSSSSSILIPYATPINGINSYEVSGYSSWSAATAKSSLYVFQTPIFGME